MKNSYKWILGKGRKFPVGTIRDWKGQKFQKKGDGSWGPVKGGPGKEPEVKEPSKNPNGTAEFLGDAMWSASRNYKGVPSWTEFRAQVMSKIDDEYDKAPQEVQNVIDSISHSEHLNRPINLVMRLGSKENFAAQQKLMEMQNPYNNYPAGVRDSANELESCVTQWTSLQDINRYADNGPVKWQIGYVEMGDFQGHRGAWVRFEAEVKVPSTAPPEHMIKNLPRMFVPLDKLKTVLDTNDIAPAATATVEKYDQDFREYAGVVSKELTDLKRSVSATIKHTFIIDPKIEDTYLPDTIKDYTDKMVEVFTEIDKHFDTTAYKPHTQALSVYLEDVTSQKIGETGLNVAAQYHSNEKSLKISPHYTNTIGHEYGHYIFDDRADDGIEGGFMYWAKEAGLYKQIRDELDKQTYATPAERDSTYDYFLRPTEIFARTFDAFLRMKGGRPDNAAGQPNIFGDVLGYGHGRLDPDYNLLKTHDFQDFLEAYVGKGLVKALIRLMMKLQKGRAYPIGTVRTWNGKKYRKQAADKWVEVHDAAKTQAPAAQKTTQSSKQAAVMEFWTKQTPEFRQKIMADLKPELDKITKDWERMKIVVNYVWDKKLMDKPAPEPSTAELEEGAPEEAAPEKPQGDAPSLYKELKTRSPFFKSWFGDWEKGGPDVSKVVKEDGSPAENYNTDAPIKLYHGTSVGGFAEFDEAKQDPSAIYGQGFYFTEDKGIAQEYAENKDATEEDIAKKAVGYKVNGKPIKYFNETGIKKMLSEEPKRTKKSDWGAAPGPDTQLTNPNWGPQIIKALEESHEPGKGYSVAKFLDAFSKQYEEKDKHGGISGAYDTHAGGKAHFYMMVKNYIPGLEVDVPKGEVFEVYLNIKKPFDCERIISKEEVTELLGQMAGEKSERKMIAGKPEYSERFQPYIDDLLKIDDWDEKIRFRVPGRGKRYTDDPYAAAHAGGLDYASSISMFTYDDIVAIRDVARSYMHEKSQEPSNWTQGWKKGEPVFPILHRNKTQELTAEEFHFVITNARHSSDSEHFNRFLRDVGYDGIHHIGGLNIGTREHSVWIAFHSNQVKAVENEGGFSMGDNNIFKSALHILTLRKTYKLEKGKSFPVGTIRDWKGKKYRKTGPGKWAEVKEGRGEGGPASMGWASRGEFFEWWKKLSADERQKIMAEVKPEWDKKTKDWERTKVVMDYVEKHNLMSPEKKAEEKPKKPETKAGVPPVVSDMMQTLGVSLDELRAQVSGVRYGKPGMLEFEFQGKTYLAPEPSDILPVGTSEASKSWALKQVLDGKAKPGKGKHKPTPKPEPPVVETKDIPSVPLPEAKEPEVPAPKPPMTDQKAIGDLVKKANPDNRKEITDKIFGVGDKLVEPTQTGTDYTPGKTTLTCMWRGAATTIESQDFTTVRPKDVVIVKEKDILTKPKPSQIPEMDEDFFMQGRNRVEFVKLGEDKYALLLTSFRAHVKVTDYSDRVAAEAAMKAYQPKIAIVNQACLALTQDYYIKKMKAKIKERAVSLGRKAPRVTTLATNRMTYEHMDFYKALYPQMSQADMWKHWKDAIDDISYATNDLNIQTEENMDTHSKGEATSYGDKGIKKDLLPDYGVLVKRQNGDAIKPAEIKAVKAALDYVYTAFGNRSSMSKNFGLKVSWAGDVGMHARKASGIYFPRWKAIGVSAGGEGFTLAHEFGHFMDNYLGDKVGYHYASDNPGTTAGRVARMFRDNMHSKNREKLSDYWNRTCECFARAMTQYAMIKSGDLDEFEAMKSGHRDAYPTVDVFKQKLYPLCEQFFQENEGLLKSLHKLVYITSLGKVRL